MLTDIAWGSNLLLNTPRDDRRREAMSIYDEADEAFERGELDRVRQLLTPAAVGGDAEAQAILGTFLTLSEHMRPFREGVDWLRSAAAAGDGVSAHNLATILLSGGPGVPADPEQAMQYLQKARESGFEATVSAEIHHDTSQSLDLDTTPLRL
jgi:TPR repeat protein